MQNKPSQQSQPQQQTPLTNAQQQQISSSPVLQHPPGLFPPNLQSNSNQQMQANLQPGLFGQTPMTNSQQQMLFNSQVPQRQSFNSIQQNRPQQYVMNSSPIFVQQVPSYNNMSGYGNAPQHQQPESALYNDDEPLIERVKE